MEHQTCESESDAPRLNFDPAARQQRALESIGYLLKRPVARPPIEGPKVLRQLQLPGAKLEASAPGGGEGREDPGEIYPRVGFIVTNMTRPAERVVALWLSCIPAEW